MRDELFIGLTRDWRIADAEPVQRRLPPALPVAQRGGARRLLDAALEAHAGWRETPLSVRARLLTELGRRLEAGREEDARLMAREMGKPLAQARAEIDKCAWACRHFAEHGAAALAPLAIATDADKSGVRFDPLGVVLGVMPWNYPYWQVIRFAVPALLAGNTCSSTRPRRRLRAPPRGALRRGGLPRARSRTCAPTSRPSPRRSATRASPPSP